MKTYFFPLFSVVFILFSCNPNHEPKERIISEEDSLKYVQEILADLKEEAYNHPSYGVVFDMDNRDKIAIYERDHFYLNFYAKDSIALRGNLIVNLVDTLCTYLEANLDSNSYENSCCLYDTYSREDCLEELEERREALREIKIQRPEITEFIDYIKAQINTWEKYIDFLDVSGSNEIKVPWEYEVKLDYDPNLKFEPIDEVLKGFLQLRERAANNYFNASYVRLYTDTSELSKRKMEAIKIIRPMVIIDMPYCTKNNIPNSKIPPFIPVLVE